MEKMEQYDEVSQQLSFERRFKKLANAIHMATTPNDIMVGLRNQILSVYHVEMATIFLVDSAKMQLVSWVLLPGEFLGKIRVAADKTSIVGYAAATRKVIVVQDAYNEEELRQIDPDLKFDSSWDKKAGSRTKQVMAIPIMFQGALMGVIQLMNKLDGSEFTENDRKHLEDLAETIGIAFRNLKQGGRRAPTKYDVLVKNDMISEKELDRAFAIANQKDENVERVLMDNFRISKFDLGNAIAQHYNTIFVDLSNLDVDTKELYEGISVDYLRKTRLVPIYFEDGKVTMVAENPDDHAHLYEMRQVFRADSVEVLFSLQCDIEDFLDRMLNPVEEEVKSEAPTQTYDEILQKIDTDEQRTKKEKSEQLDAEKRPIVMLVNKIIEDAYKKNASDIHIEPYGMARDGEVRYRVDGQCMNVLNIPREHVRPVVARFKVLADLDIAERRKPQDGKIKFTTSTGKGIELRVATVPTADGNEDVVLRVLAGSKPLPLNKLMPLRQVAKFEPLISSPYGIVLVVGPTGSGKTTTLHSALNYINTPDKKIWTAEDPVEITQYRLRQVQIRSKIGLTFASAMRSFLRADPDVIMVGEMRDQETVKMGIEASLTGHLVFSTLHTNSASETIVRLIDMGMDPFNFSDALLGILAQRLVRTLCPKCRKKYTPDQAEYEHLKNLYGEKFDKDVNRPFSDKLNLYKANGCESCNDTGYKGRAGLYELLVKDEKLNKLIIERATVDEIKKAAMEAGMTTLLQEGIQMVFAGRTDYKQVMRVCM